jgi:teichuronic acid biosynthesis glycosyltransferase TuaH
MRFRIVYVMNVDWDWAKQRPHFIAQHLSRSHDMIVLYPFASRRSNLAKNERDGLKLIPFFRIPFGGTFPFIRKLNLLLLRVIAYAFLKRCQPDMVWISSPELSEYLPKHLSSKLIYDCMDDVLAFPTNASRKIQLATNEKQLLSKSTHVFCSSENLRDKLIARCGRPEIYSVVHNAFEPSSFSNLADRAKENTAREKYILGYVGTISSWMDFEALFKIVNEFSSIEIHLMGPIENLGMPLPQHERIKYLGIVRHRDIQSRVTEFDALMMPFIVTDLILSVDPVKLYEYTYFNKPILSVQYPEIERFADFVDFYSDHQGLLLIIKRHLKNGFKKKYSDAKRMEFINLNTWADRVDQVNRVFNEQNF